jgi:hypothetical protein
MAKNDRPFEDKGKVKFRFVEFELEGLNSTIEESIKSIVHSMNRGSLPPARTISPSPKTANPTILPPGKDNGDAEVVTQPEYVQDIESAEEETAEEVPTSRPGASKTTLRRYPIPEFLSALDLDTGNPSFKAFAEEQGPKSDNRKYLVVAAWLKKNRSLDVITTDHIYTCNQKMGWKTQKDVGQPFRYMKKKSYFETAGRNQWRITHIGLDQLESPESEL